MRKRFPTVHYSLAADSGPIDVRALVVATIWGAVVDAMDLSSEGRIRDRRRKARVWFEGGIDDDYIFSFKNCCEICSFNAPMLRSAILEIIKQRKRRHRISMVYKDRSSKT